MSRRWRWSENGAADLQRWIWQSKEKGKETWMRFAVLREMADVIKGDERIERKTKTRPFAANVV